MAIEWDSSGVLPKVIGSGLAIGEQSPFRVTLLDVADLFVVSKERLDIFRGFINYRKALHETGICEGFQWINGSFVEDVEVFRGTPPHDIDIVTFTYLPKDCNDQHDLYSRHPELFDPTQTKAKYRVDGYLELLGQPMTVKMVHKVTYWHNLWSHQRGSFAEKGFVELDLSPEEDSSADVILKMKEKEMQNGQK
ncbi:MAG: hypothetical protein FWG02_11460 [Holophagaceae bacterium]|nr:hypothetical protein [Holophagaceae bacterium]